MPEALVDPLVRFFVNSTSCVPPFVQLAGIAALQGPWDDIAAMMAEFRARRTLVVEGLNALPGVSCRTPAGAFYAFPNVRGTGFGADELAQRLLDEAGVAVLVRARRSAGRARQSAALVRELAGESGDRARADRRVPGGEVSRAPRGG